jgi:hypothetical protein
MIVSLGKYFIKAFSTKVVKLISSTTACALACLTTACLTKSVIRCFWELFVFVVVVVFVIVNILNVLQQVV